MSDRCDICEIKGAKRFQLTHRTRGTTRGVGSIALCAKCWRQTTEGHRRRRVDGRCAQGLHEMSGENLMFHADGHRICRACRRASQDKYNEKARLQRQARGLSRAPWAPELQRARAIGRWSQERNAA